MASVNQYELNLEEVTSQVLHNCEVSDSQYAGLYSVCGLALRLRDLYKWEYSLAPWVEVDSSEILDWIGEKEETWERLMEESFDDISILGHSYDPFDAKGINKVLEPYGFFYGAGFVQSLRPTFFLAALEEKRRINGHHVYILGQEKARDLLTLPALTQQDEILIRRESARLFLWDRIFFLGKSGREALKFALETYGIESQDNKALRSNLAQISDNEIETYIYHELGEIHDTNFDRDIWREIIAAFPHSPIELLVRTIKDILADTNEQGTLSYIMKERKKASLAFYVAFLDGLRKVLFPELVETFQSFAKTHDWKLVDQAVSSGYNNAKKHTETICRIFNEGKEKNDMAWAAEEIDTRVLTPLGIGRAKRESPKPS